MRKRNIGIGAIVVVAGLVVLGSTVGPSKKSATDDTRVAGVLAANVKDAYATDDWYPTLQQVNGLPNIQVVATSTAFVFTKIANTDLGKSNGAAVCRAVAAVTNDPDTSQPLGIRHVKVDGGSGNEELAACDVP